MGCVLIIGRADAACCRLVSERLAELGAETLFLQEDRLFPGIEMIWDLHDGVSGGSLRFAGQTAEMRDIEAVLARFSGFPISSEEFQTPNGQYLCSEWSAFLRGYVTALECPVINRVPPPLWYKPLLSAPDLLSLAPNLQFRLPRTLITTNFENARSFFEACGGRMRYRAVTISSNYVITTEEDFKKLETLVRLMPLCLSEIVPGDETDVYVVGERVISNGLNGGAEREVAAHCLETARELGLAFCRFPLARTEDGEWYCGGLDCAPDMVLCGEELGRRLADSLAQALMAGAEVLA